MRSRPQTKKRTHTSRVKLQIELLESRLAPAAIVPGFDSQSVPASDDGSTAAIDLGFTLNFFGTSYTQVFVNNNGNVTFGSASSQYTPTALTNSGQVPRIAPFFADVDTRTGNLATYGTGTVDNHPAFGVTWPGVGYYSQHTDKTNKFQVILISREDRGAGDFDIEFNYDQIQWETGDASGGSGGLGGTPARLGYTNGSGDAGTYFELSGATGAFLDSNQFTGLIHQHFNSDVDGRFVFNVHAGQVLTMPLPLNLSVSGAINANNPSNDWTFFDRANHAVTINVHTGAQSSAPQPLTPTLDYAQVQLLDDSGNVLASSTNTSAGTDVSLVGITLPADGTYHVHVTASPNQSTSVGNYVVLAGEATTHDYPLITNQIEYGQLYSPFAVDRWTFTGTANQQVQFNLLGAANTGIQFDLTGPGGATLFSNLSASSDPVTLPTSGPYVLRVHSAGGGAGPYSFSINQIAQTALTLGTAYAGTLLASGQIQLFKVDVATGNPLLVQLSDSTSTDSNEVYVRRGSPPTRGTYDYRFAQAGASQTVQVPFATPGTWYILVYSRSVPSPSNFTLLAQTNPVFLNAVTPNQYATNQTATVALSGSGFLPGTQVTLESAGTTVATAQQVQIDSFAQLTATFDLHGVADGTYDLRVTLPGGSSAVLSSGFTVLPAGQAHLETNIILPGVLGRHHTATIYVEYANTGNVAMPAPILTLEATNGIRPFLTLDQSLLVEGMWTSALPAGFSNSIQIYASGATPGVLLPGERIRVPVYYAGLQQPWDFNNDNVQDYAIVVHDAGNTDPVDWAGMKDALRPSWIPTDAWDAVYPNLTAEVGSTWGDYVNMLNANAVYLGQLGENVSNVNALFSFALQQAIGLSSVSLLTSAVDASVATPGLALAFTRSFGSSILDRYQTGPFGRGWSAPWQIFLEQQADGTVVIHDAAGSLRMFQPDSRTTGAYFSQPGDAGVLRKGGDGTWTLTETNGQVTRFRADGTLEYVQDINGNRITAGFTAGRLTSLTHSSGASLTFAYNGAGLISSITAFASAADTTGRTTTYTYDPTNTYLVSVTDPGGTTSYTYDTGTDPAHRYALLSITGPSGVTQSFEYDAQGRLSATSLTGNAQRVTYSYHLGAVTATDAANVSTTAYFDQRGLMVRTQDGLGNYLNYTYNDQRQLITATDSQGHSVDYTRCDCGRPTSITDQLGNTLRFTLGGPNNSPTAFTDANSNATNFGYDANGNLNLTTYADGSHDSVVYNALGNPSSLVNRNGQAVTMTYNAAGQLTQEIFPDSSSYTYTYDVRGRLATAVDSQGTTTFTYDDADRLTEVDYPGSRWIKYTYDGAGRRVLMEDNTGFKVSYAYDAAGRLSELRDVSSSPTGTLIVHYTYDAAGRLQRADKGNGTYTVYSYDGAGQVASVVNHAPDNSVNSRFDYTYDGVGHRTSMTTLDGTWTYTYDLTGQLTHAVFASTNAQIPSQDLSYVYDAMGNLVRTVLNGTTTNYTANNLNEYTSVGGVTYTYDAAGNLTSDGTSQYTYDALNRLTQVVNGTNTWQYQYDALGNLVATTFNGQTTQYVSDPLSQGSVEAVYNSTNTQTAAYASGLGLTGALVSGGWNYYDFDALGSTVGISSTGGTYANSYAYAPFGNTLLSTGSLANPFQFVGAAGVMTEGDGLASMGARFYSLNFDRFTSVDPTRLNGGDGNLYRYAGNDPVTNTDPSGLWSQFFGLQGGLGGAGTLGVTVNSDCQAFLTVGLGLTTGGLTLYSVNTGNADPGFNSELSGTVGHFFGGVTGHAGGNENTGGYVAGSIDIGFGVPGGSWMNSFNIPLGRVPGCDPPPQPPNSPTPPGNTGSTNSSGTADSQDPNGLIGPAGFGSQNYLTPQATFPYRIDFENAPTASAPAQRVVVTERLSSNLDWSTFEFTDIGFGDTNLVVPAGSQHYETTVVKTYNGKTFNVDIAADLDAATGLLTVTFQSIDPGTNLPPDVLTGFLPPEDGTGRGDGYIDYLIQPRSDLATGTQIRSVALIQFDANTIIATNQVSDTDPALGTDPSKEALVTIDAGGPTSSVRPLPASTSSPFTVSWSGQDDAGGSGIAFYNVYVSDNGGAFTPLLLQTTQTSTSFSGQVGHTYGFYSVATDNVGHREAVPAGAQASTLVVSISITPPPPPAPAPAPLPRPAWDTVGAFDPATATWYLRDSNSPGGPDVAPFTFGRPNWIPVMGDWDGSGTTTIGVVDPATMTWYLKNSNSPGAPDITPFQYGAAGWIPVVGDWNGDGTTTVGVVDPTTMTWYLRNSNSPGAPDITPFKYGAAGWSPVVGDWNGDGTTTIGAVDPTTEAWYLRNSNSPGAPDITPFKYGAPGWIPIVGDWNADGTTTIGVVDPTTETWYLRNSNGPGAADVSRFAYGAPGWSPLAGDWDGSLTTALWSVNPANSTWYARPSDVPAGSTPAPVAYGPAGSIAFLGDWNGDGTATLGAFDPTTATWYLRNSNTPGAPDITPFQYGAPGWLPVVGDWNGDGIDTIGVVDPRTMTWYLRNSNSPGAPDVTLRYGAAGWIPVVGDWDNNGTTTIGVVDPSTETWYLRNSNTAGAPDIAPFRYGAPEWWPVAGDWDGQGTTGIGVLDPATASWYLRSTVGPGVADLGVFVFGEPGWGPVIGHKKSS